MTTYKSSMVTRQGGSEVRSLTHSLNRATTLSSARCNGLFGLGAVLRARLGETRGLADRHGHEVITRVAECNRAQLVEVQIAQREIAALGTMVADTHTLADALPQGSHAAIIDVKSGQTLPASSLRSLVLATAASLRASGVQPGQTVSIVDANTVLGPNLMVADGGPLPTSPARQAPPAVIQASKKRVWPRWSLWLLFLG